MTRDGPKKFTPLESRPLPSPTDYLQKIIASGLLQNMQQGIDQQAKLSADIAAQPKQEQMTQRARVRKPADVAAENRAKARHDELLAQRLVDEELIRKRKR
jgi:hypothetical protein